MTFIKQQLDTVQNYFKSIDEIEKARSKWIADNPNTQGGWYYKENMAKFDSLKDDARKKVYQDLQYNFAGIKSSLHSEMKGSELSDDVKLLNGSFKLTEADLNRMLDRDENKNPTMKRVINEYAKNHDLTLNQPYYSDGEITEMAKNFTAYCKNAVSMPDYRKIVETPEMLAKITPTELKDI